ncbi:Heavy metal tolerance protein [Tolypocladium ophioglossoides CBS 100239]|uniref:Heavy metal tolerance protein n=1 Tax=Tolypocladium ophioglossoides (strain CBS 100239) TaxID=1163406 RepID=A0A0L0N7S3_TOLOC|nr:Heavy metal tolerance protein [Tolypocladium ophioglossoides CBS 100239]
MDVGPGGPSERMVHILHIACPIAVVVLFAAFPIVRFFTQAKSKQASYSVGATRRNRLVWLTPAVCVTFSQLRPGDLYSQNTTIYALASILVWATVSISLLESKAPLWPAYIAAWTAGAVVDAVLLGLFCKNISLDSGWDFTRLSVHAARSSLFITAVVYALCSIQRDNKMEAGADEETRSLLGSTHSRTQNGPDSASPTAYGSIPGDTGDEAGHIGDAESDDDDGEREIKEMQQKRLEEQGGWLGYLRSFVIFLPYILPYKDRPTQLWLLVMAICMAVDRVLTLMIPRQLGILTESLGGMAGTGVVPWKDIAIWAVLQFPIHACTSMLEQMASTRVSQYAYRRLTEAAFAHVMTLSMDYHTTKSSGRVSKAIEQGSNLSSVLDSGFGIAPMVIDFVVAIIYLTSYFDSTMGFVVIATAMAHAYVAFKGNGLIMSYERELNETSRGENEVLYDSITNWQTVAYHNRRRFEQERYSKSIWKAVMARRKYYDGNGYINAVENFVMEAGLVAACAVVAMRVAAGTAKLSSFVFLISYWDAIRAPMDSLSWTFHETASHLIDAEWLYQLLQTKPSVGDKKGAWDIRLKGGRVEFKNVSFAYGPDRPIVQDMSFTAEPGQSVALVGETGGGKSTTLKLLYRFYDVTSGSVVIDGQDIRDVTLDSLRESLGAVPQDPSVFDQTIMENIIYARPSATEADVIDACKAARIHHQIMKFPEGYATRLGERGVRLSGGELQRLAIARVILRRSSIVVLDEATSAVDSDTEALVQQAIRALSAGRTVFTVAHRLSTVVAADMILVVDGGRVVERGTHAELLALGGKYSRLWAMQTMVSG